MPDGTFSHTERDEAADLTIAQQTRLEMLRSMEPWSRRTMDGYLYGWQRTPISGFVKATDEDRALLAGKPLPRKHSTASEIIAARVAEEQRSKGLLERAFGRRA